VDDTISSIPPGWYPDPAGLRQWRVWNGTEWSDVTRPYGEATLVPRLESPGATGPLPGLALISSLRRLTHFGVLAYYAGLALLVGVIAHWPGHSHPATARFASATLGAGVGLTLIGTISFGVCVRSLRGRWTLDALVPVVNSFAAAWWICNALGLPAPAARVGSDAIITLGFLALSARQPWVGLALAAVAVTQLSRAYALIDQVSGPTKSPTPAP